MAVETFRSQMRLLLPDTHAVFWYEFGNPKLSNVAEQAFRDADGGNAQLVIHPVVLAEFFWLLRKAGLEASFLPYIDFVEKNRAYRYETITREDLRRLRDFDEIPEMHDRLIAISVQRLGATIVTRDAALQACSKVTCTW